MANQLSSNPWIIDSTSATPYFLGTMQHAQIEYIDYTSAQHHVEVQDRLGRIIARLKGDADLHTVRTGRMGWIYGLMVPPTDSDGATNLQSGRIVVYFE